MPNTKLKNKKKVFCFGELLLRMSPLSNGEWITKNSIPTYVGGAELNVATALAKWGLPTKYFTALPDHSLSHELIDYLKKKNIDTSSINLSGNRIGLYFLPQGKDLKNAGVIYDRMHSSFSDLVPKMIDWDTILKDVEWLHFSAITPALNKNLVAVTKELLEVASAKKITISVDLNYRSKLWKYGKDPVKVMPELVEHCNVIMGNIWSAATLLDIPVDIKILRKNNKNAYIEHAEYTSKALMKKFPKCKHVANTFRFDKKNNGIHYFATLYSGKNLYVADEIESLDIKDKIGSGDCFMAGLIYGLQNKHEPQDIVNFAASAAVCKMYETNDATSKTVEQIHSDIKQFNHA